MGALSAGAIIACAEGVFSSVAGLGLPPGSVVRAGGPRDVRSGRCPRERRAASARLMAVSLHVAVEVVSVYTLYLPDCCPAALCPSLLLVLLPPVLGRVCCRHHPKQPELRPSTTRHWCLLCGGGRGSSHGRRGPA